HGLPLMFSAGLFCVLFACGDEYHQSFVSDRGPSVRDVLIDSFGIFWGIILVRIIGWTGRHTIFRPFNSKKKRAKKETASAWDTPQRPYAEIPQGYHNTQPGSIYNSYSSQQSGTYNNYNANPHGTCSDYSTQPDTPKKKKKQNQSDNLSEDMSLKNLIYNLRNREE
ncbi:MAG: VanZ family protein, partial [Lachnospiraceae bacterium]|nr:VanZ family protein [Lachnospiraceae bacterium]